METPMSCDSSPASHLANAEHNPGDSSDSDSSDEDVELERRAEELERSLADNKYLYDVHVELLDVYRKLADFKSLQAAFERFHDYYPLTPELWLSWIREEIKLAYTEKDKERVKELFELAVQDYLSVGLWQEYIQFSIGHLNEIEQIRAVIEKAITAAGNHVTEGHLLWDLYREFELAHLNSAPHGSEKWQKQIEKLYEVFKRQLSIPLLNMELTYEEFKQWLEQLPEEQRKDSKEVDWAYNRAIKLLETLKPFEDRLISTEDENELHEIYKEYIKAVSEPMLILGIYERAVAQLPLNTQLWIDYCTYLIKLGDVALSVSKRALRNCTGSEQLWITRLRIMEHLKQSPEEVQKEFEQGLYWVQPGLDLWLAYIEYVHRNDPNRDHLHKLFTQAIEQLGDNGDPSFKLRRWQARLLAKEGKMSEARNVWKALLHINKNKEMANLWLEYLNLERIYGDVGQLRSLFGRALSSCKDWPQAIAEEWVMFERECGSLEDMMKCLQKTKVALSQFAAVSSKQADTRNGEATTSKGRKRPAAGTVHDEEVSSKKPKVPQRKMEVKYDPVTSVFVSNLTPSATEEDLKKAFPNAKQIDLVTDRKGVSRCFGYVQFADQEEVQPALERDREPLKNRPMFISKCKASREEDSSHFKYSTTTESNKLFIRGLPVSLTKKELEEIYKPHNAKDVRLITHKSGRPKGLAYVEFETDDAAADALKATDQMEIKGHKISVAISAPPPKRTNMQLKEPVRHARSRLQVPLVPMVVQKTAEGRGDAPKSNEDFRKMFLKK